MNIGRMGYQGGIGTDMCALLAYGCIIGTYPVGKRRCFDVDVTSE